MSFFHKEGSGTRKPDAALLIGTTRGFASCAMTGTWRYWYPSPGHYTKHCKAVPNTVGLPIRQGNALCGDVCHQAF